jgi:tetratricopeptide (TPR) repeat protein
MANVCEFAPGEWCFDDERGDAVVSDLFNEACEALEDGDLDVAADTFRAVLSVQPLHIDALHNLSIAHHRSGRNVEARILAKEATNIGLSALPKEFSWNTSQLSWGHLSNRPFLRSYHNHALWLDRTGDLRAAEQIYARLVAVCPTDNLGVRCLLMQCFLRRSDWIAATRLADTYPDDTSPDILYSTALVSYESGNIDRAVDLLKRAYVAKPNVGKELLKSKHVEPPPSFMPDSVISGGADEAYHYWLNNGEYWKRNGDLMLVLDKIVRGSQ